MMGLPGCIFVLAESVKRQAAEAELEMRALMAIHGCPASHIRIEYRYCGCPPYTVRYVPPEERWLDWLSDNHGYGTYR